VVDALLARALEDAPAGKLGEALPAGTRTATCSALDELELARLSRADFLDMLRTFPTLRRRLVEMAIQRLRHDFDNHPSMRQYIEQGLYQGQSLLLLDLTRCTQCGECVRACEDQHGSASHGMPITRLLLEGRQFGDYMVARSCRSCKDAYCMVGCPVDSIHRGKHLQIVIEDHCIGCGLCAENCPYDNIFMPANLNAAPELAESGAPESGAAEAAGRGDGPADIRAEVRQPKAATCDLCDAGGERDEPLPRCVYACPHDAAHRMTGEELLYKMMSADTPVL
jgi:Fe-S-cluster-containing hydrogenase component 2